jgi:RNA polymerase sigma factor (sigma-70 family)
LQPRSDEELMLSVKQGRLHSLGELFERHHVKLFNYFLKFCGNRHWSEDMVQNTFLKMLKYASSYRDTGACLAWIFNIARNVGVDYLQAEQNRSHVNDMDPDTIDDPYSDPEYLEEMKQGEKQLQQALLQLTPENMSGSVVAETTNGEVQVTMLSVAKDTPMAFSTTNGSVDVTLPGSYRADATLDPGRGATCTDFDIDVDKTMPQLVSKQGDRGKRIEMKREIHGRLNGGGPSLRMSTFNGNLYIRKGK